VDSWFCNRLPTRRAVGGQGVGLINGGYADRFLIGPAVVDFELQPVRSLHLNKTLISISPSLAKPATLEIKSGKKTFGSFLAASLITFVMSSDHRPHPGNRWASTFSARLVGIDSINHFLYRQI
jgi:hypothetical protein